MTLVRSPYVLVIDNDRDGRDLYATVLGIAGYRVVTAEHGEAARVQAHLDRPTLVLTELRLPGPVPSAEVCRHFRQLAVPVLVVSGVGAGREEDEAWRAGCDDILRKPLDPSVLVRRVRSALARPHEFA